MNHYCTTPLLASLAAGMLFAQEVPKKPGESTTPSASQQKSVARCKASQLIGTDITNSKNENLGEIEDIVLDAENRKIAYAVVGFGGFLGMGEKYFAMPWHLVQIERRGTEDEPRATLGLDQATLKGAPGFDKSNWPDMANASWTEQVDSYYRSRGEKTPSNDPAERQGSNGENGFAHSSGVEPFALRRLTHIIGMDVVDQLHVKVAEIEDLVVDTKAATIDGALLSFGGTLGIGEKLVLVASETMSLDREKGVFVFPCNRSGLEAMALPGNKWPPLDNDSWRTKCLEHCAKMNVTLENSGVVPAAATINKDKPFVDTFDAAKSQTVEGTVVTIGSARVGEQHEARLRLRVRTRDGSEVLVYGAPVYVADQQALELRAGKTVSVEGSPAKDGSQTVLIARSIASNGKKAVLRDAAGQPSWTQRKQ